MFHNNIMKKNDSESIAFPPVETWNTILAASSEHVPSIMRKMRRLR